MSSQCSKGIQRVGNTVKGKSNDFLMNAKYKTEYHTIQFNTIQNFLQELEGKREIQTPLSAAKRETLEVNPI